METEVDKEILKSAGAELLPDGRKGLRIHDWEIETIRGTILTSLAHEQYSNLYLSHLSVCALLLGVVSMRRQFDWELSICRGLSMSIMIVNVLFWLWQ